MSLKNTKVYLGFEDEPILPQHIPDVTYTTNKIGGNPDWPPITGLEFDSKCPVCGLHRPLILQCYAPLPDSPYHRTLYVFGCINPTCWNDTNSWNCYRSQFLDPQYENKLKETSSTQAVKELTSPTSASWCSGADEWGEDEEVLQESDTSNVFSGSSIAVNPSTSIERMSDSDDEVSEMDQIEKHMENINITKDNPESSNSNRRMIASAELEEKESSDVIAIDELPLPENNILSLLSEVPDLPEELKTGNNINFEAKFIAVDEEYFLDGISDHVKKLLEKYEKENKDDLPNVNKDKSKGSKNYEEYEEAVPLHGHELFYNFKTRIQMYPTQILRYSLGGQPLPMSPLPTSMKLKKCSHCSGQTSFELQILPTIIPSLKLANSNLTHLEFGTVLIYTCVKSCWSDENKIQIEAAFVQSEPL